MNDNDRLYECADCQVVSGITGHEPVLCGDCGDPLPVGVLSGCDGGGQHDAV